MSVEGLGGYRPENLEDPEGKALEDGSEKSSDEEEEQGTPRRQLSSNAISAIQNISGNSELEKTPKEPTPPSEEETD